MRAALAFAAQPIALLVLAAMANLARFLGT